MSTVKTILAILLLISCISGVMGTAVNESTTSGFSFGYLQALKNAERTDSQAKQHDVFTDLRTLLAAKTSVPLRLPDLHIAFGNQADALYAVLENADSSHYEVQVALTKDCPGSNYCHVGTVRGSTAPLVEDEGPRIPVTLEEGIKGYFIDATCAAFCDDSSVGWKEGGYFYSISLKAAKMQTLVKLANSAIVRGRRQKL